MIEEDGVLSKKGNILIKVEFTKNVIWRPQDIDFSFERTQKGTSVSQWIGVWFSEVVGEKGVNLVYIYRQCLEYILVPNVHTWY